MTLRTVAILSPGEMGGGVGAALLRHGHVVDHLPRRAERPDEGARRAAGVPDSAPTSTPWWPEADIVLSILPPEAARATAEEVAAAMRRTGEAPPYAELNADRARDLARRRGGSSAAPARTISTAASSACRRRRARKPTRIYVSGNAAPVMDAFDGKDMTIHQCGPEIGRASSVKMCYASISKGTNTLHTAAMTAADSLGVGEHPARRDRGFRARRLRAHAGQRPAPPGGFRALDPRDGGDREDLRRGRACRPASTSRRRRSSASWTRPPTAARPARRWTARAPWSRRSPPASRNCASAKRPSERRRPASRSAGAAARGASRSGSRRSAARWSWCCRRAPRGPTVSRSSRRSEGWIAERTANALSRVPFADGTVLPFLGGALTIRATGRVRAGARRDGDTLFVSGRPEDVPQAGWKPGSAAPPAPRSSPGLREKAARLGKPHGRIDDPRHRFALGQLLGQRQSRLLLAPRPGAARGSSTTSSPTRSPTSPSTTTASASGRMSRRLCEDAEGARRWLRRNGAALHRYG